MRQIERTVRETARHGDYHGYNLGPRYTDIDSNPATRLPDWVVLYTGEQGRGAWRVVVDAHGRDCAYATPAEAEAAAIAYATGERQAYLYVSGAVMPVQAVR
jgi:hypothetical protein